MKIDRLKENHFAKKKNRKIGRGYPCFIIAEAGVNHNGSLETAKKLVDIAVCSGVDAIKFQTFKADSLVASDAPKAAYQLKSCDINESQYDMLHRLELSPKAHQELFEYCGKKDILFMSTPFDEESATMLADLGVEYLKIASGEIINLPFLSHVAQLHKPIILSTGMSYLSEVDEAVRTIQQVWKDVYPRENWPPLILLHCLTEYPAPMAEINLRAMTTLGETFKLPVGYSDHTVGIEVPIAAVALGATVVEKHFTLDKNLPGPDHRASLEPEELKNMVQSIRNIEAALGDGVKVPAHGEVKNRQIVRKSLVAARDLKEGHKISPEDVVAKRPGSGIKPCQKELVTGSVLQKAITKDTPLNWGHLIRC